MSKQEAARAFRNALGSFATGVTVATTIDRAGQPIGVTASSFNSVSLDPPLVLWSLAKDSLSRESFCEGGHFAVHILKASQEELSNRFARSGADKFAGVAWSKGVVGSPILDDYAALFQCRTRHLYDGGDHIILVGEVADYRATDAEPLLFHAGSYAERRARRSEHDHGSVDLNGGRFTEDFLFYLVTRAHYQMSFPVRANLASQGVSDTEYLILAALSMEAPMTRVALEQAIHHTGARATSATLDSMTERALLHRSHDIYALADLGKTLFIDTLAEGKAFDEVLSEHFTASEIHETKRVLKKIIALTSDAIASS